MKDPWVVDKYNEALEKQMTYHNLFDKTENNCESAIDDTWTAHHAREYEKIDTLLIESAVYAERSISKRYSTNKAWSPKLDTVVNTLRYWRLRLKIDRKIRVSPGNLLRHLKAASLDQTECSKNQNTRGNSTATKSSGQIHVRHGQTTHRTPSVIP